jgi:transposase
LIRLDLAKEIKGFSLAQFGRALLDEAGIWPDLQPVLRVEIVKRSDDMKGFIVLPRRSVAVRTLSWFGRNRRRPRNYENLADALPAFITLACIQGALKATRRGPGS